VVTIYERKRQLIQFYAQHWKCGKKTFLYLNLSLDTV